MSPTSAPLDSFFATFERSAFRLQLLPAYDIPAEREEFARYQAGEPAPDRKADHWLETIRSQVKQGRTWTTIHLLPPIMTPYLRYLVDWWLVLQARAGARVGFLRSEHEAQIRNLAHEDFWLFDDARILLLDYDTRGRYRGATELVSSDALDAARRARDFAVANAVDLSGQPL